jgi:hypothetical protein
MLLTCFILSLYTYVCVCVFKNVCICCYFFVVYKFCVTFLEIILFLSFVKSYCDVVVYYVIFLYVYMFVYIGHGHNTHIIYGMIMSLKFTAYINQLSVKVCTTVVCGQVSLSICITVIL